MPNFDCLLYTIKLRVRVLLLSFVELETKRILLDIFKEKQQKSAEAATIPSFYKKARGNILSVLVIMFMVGILSMKADIFIYFQRQFKTIFFIVFLFTLL